MLGFVDVAAPHLDGAENFQRTCAEFWPRIADQGQSLLQQLFSRLVFGQHHQIKGFGSGQLLS